MATTRIGEVMKGEGPLLSPKDGIIVPFDFKNETHQVGFSNLELDNLAYRSMKEHDFRNHTALDMPGLDLVFVRPHYTVSNEGTMGTIASISSFTDNPYAGLVLNIEGRVGEGWKLREREEVPTITLMTLAIDQMVSGILSQQLERTRREIKSREDELLEHVGANKTSYEN